MATKLPNVFFFFLKCLTVKVNKERMPYALLTVKMNMIERVFIFSNNNHRINAFLGLNTVVLLYSTKQKEKNSFKTKKIFGTFVDF